jgi:hypothetical protein
MDVELPITILRQPDDTTCGPTCLHAVYNYYGEDISLDEVITDTETLQAGGTLAVFLACAALRRGYKATIYTYNLQVFDPTWFASPDIDIAERLIKQAEAKEDKKLRFATEGYLEFLRLGGKLRYVDLTTGLLRNIIRRRLPILTGLSSTYLYKTKRDIDDEPSGDDIRGYPDGHFVILSGYHRHDRTVLINDPYEPNPVSGSLTYAINIDRVICAILLGVLTYDANLLVIQPANSRKKS